MVTKLTQGFWAKTARIILRNRILILVLLTVLTVFLAMQWENMRFSNTQANLLPDHHPVNLEYLSFLEKFGEEGNVVVLAVKDSSLFTPEAVVTLVIRVAFPILEITRCKERAWFPCFFTSCWYLLIKKIQFGIPITMINGGIKAVRTVISYCKSPRTPKDHITPIITTNIEIKVALKLLKKKKNIKEVTPKAARINFPISSIMFWEFMVRI